ncbi:hypothetical protein D8674_031268 [Pyrus ussuriensis x Pyrus communis]|uniref:Uncharacterized protein n=1 Tax=Pyrus ussuriensis x Pyrus communis TaxID=2448454 RepID=A0A5N5EY20_9ROSA|nr:hypothetical protein D8674_031268 [Pyrus ussuriensis x Pyrus communis]
MVEPAGVTDNKVDQVLEDRDEEHNDRPTPSQLPNSEFTAELNLLTVFLSLFSVSTDESLNSAERQHEMKKDVAKATKKLQINRRETDEVKPVRRQNQRCRTSIRDSRHGRRV